MEFTKIGELHIDAKKIDITDPCYDEPDLTVSIIPGDYECYAGEDRMGKTRISVLVKKGWWNRKNADMYLQDSHGIGVDSGTAGFFVEKPVYDNEKWKEICNFTFNEDKTDRLPLVVSKDSPFGCDGFVTSTGDGDGSYLVDLFADKKTDEVIAYKITF